MWRPPVAPSRLEGEVIKRVKRARLFVWLRQHRHELLDEGFQAELAGMYDPRPLGQPPVPPA
jgi:transposase